MESVSVPSSANAGSSISISGTVKNKGGTSAVSSYVKYYLSDDTSLSSDDTYLSSDYVNSLGSGRSSYESASVTIPSTTSSGTKYVLFVADANKTVTETNENNNIAYKAIKINSVPDLVVQNSYVPNYGFSGSSIYVNGTVKNTGSGSASSSTLHYYLSRNDYFSIYDTYLGYDNVSSLNASSSSYESASLTLPSSVSGKYYLFFVADANKTVTESNESNNLAYKSIYIY